jgi:hypothetical protein
MTQSDLSSHRHSTYPDQASARLATANLSRFTAGKTTHTSQADIANTANSAYAISAFRQSCLCPLQHRAGDLSCENTMATSGRRCHSIARFMKATLRTGLCALPAVMPAACMAQSGVDRIVWAHQMGVMPSDSGMQYGSTYPIVLYDNSSPTARTDFPKQFVSSVIASGVQGLAFEINPDVRSNAPSVPQYESMVKMFAGSGILVAPCLDIGKAPQNVDSIVDAIEKSSVIARTNGNPALMRDGRFIVFLYAAQNQGPDAWAHIRAKLLADGYKVLLVGDAGQANVPPARAISNATALAASWDGAFNFSGVGMSGAPDSNAAFNKALAAQNRMWVASLMPGYYRGINVSANWGPFNVDALGTARLRSLWQDVLQSGIKWVYWITNNDFIEHTNLIPDSAWGYTRSDMNLWYSRNFTGSRYPYGPALYLTTPQTLHVGDRSVVELAVINPLATPSSASVQLIADNGDVLGSTTLQIGAHRLDAIQMPVSAPATGRYTYARAVAKGPGGQITSAPILLSGQARAARDHGGTGYYSVNSRLTVPAGWHPTITLQGNGVRISGIDAGTVLSADLLSNGNLVDQSKFPAAGPITLNTGRVLRFGRDTNDNKNSVLYSAPALSIVRLVLKNGAIWYSAPLSNNRPAP